MAKITKPEIQQLIIDDYHSQNFTIESLAKKYSVSKCHMRTFLLRKVGAINKDLIRKYKLDYDFFENVDTEAKAYFLGLLYADGNVASKRADIVISLQEEDKEILEIFKREIRTDRDLIFKNKKTKKHKNQFTLTFYSLKMKNDLIKLGCWPNKSLNLKFPDENQVPDDLIHHFIRGYFDGDGCICKTKNNLYRGNVTSTIYFIEPLQKLLWKKLGIKNPIINRKKYSTTRELHISNEQKLKLFMDFIYKDAKIFLQRKYDKYRDFLQKIENKKNWISPNCRKCKLIDNETGFEWEGVSINDLAAKSGVSKRIIQRRARGETTKNRYTFIYVTESAKRIRVACQLRNLKTGEVFFGESFRELSRKSGISLTRLIKRSGNFLKEFELIELI